MKWIYEEKSQNSDRRYMEAMKSRIEVHEHVLEGVTASEVMEELCSINAGILSSKQLPI